MTLIANLRHLFGKAKDNAPRTDDAQDGGQQIDRSGIHPFATQRERTLSDLRRVEVLAKEMLSQRSGASDTGKGHSLRDLIELAKAHDLYLSPDNVRELGKCISKRTGESAVNWNRESSAYYKVKNPAAKQPIKQTKEGDWLLEHIIHNILFPSCAYDFLGLTTEMNELRIVLKQAAVRTETLPTHNQIEDFLQLNLGLAPEDRYFYGNVVLSLTDVGERSDNVLVGDDNRLYFIDPLIRLKRPALEVIEFLTGVTLSCA